MKTLKKLLMLVVALVMAAGMNMAVKAETTTDLSDMKVYALNAAGKKTEVPMNFEPTTYTYDLTIMSDAVKIQIEATPADNTSKWVVEKEWANTKMDFGKNLTEVSVTSASGKVQKYTLNTTKLTEAEQATYKPEDTDNKNDNSDSKVSKDKKDTTVKVGKKEMKISNSFDKKEIPEGFKKASAEYQGKKYSCIKGEVKDITAFYLYDKDSEGFYIYKEDSDEFYQMNNIKIKSRMYTIVKPEKKDGILKNYDTKTVEIIDQQVKAWILDEEEGMYLVYAMNWNGETSLYTYDDHEKCFQRYLVSLDSNKQSEAAAKAYDNLHKDYNKLVDKYNILLKVLCVMAIIIIILIFVIINLKLNRKEKKAKKAALLTGDSGEEPEEDIEEPDFEYEIDVPEVTYEEDEKEESQSQEAIQPEDVADIEQEKTIDQESEIDDEDFYGGELEEENEVFIDLTDDMPLNEEEEEKQELPQDGDEDFEFIDLDE